MYYEGGDKQKIVCTAGDAKHDLAQSGMTVQAQKNVITTVGKQQDITNEVDKDYEKQANSIDAAYANVDGLRPSGLTTSFDLPAPGGSTCRPDAAPAKPATSKIYRLTPQQCDKEVAKLVGLQKWVTEQRNNVAGR